MRRAVLALLLMAALPHPARAEQAEGAVDAIGMIDYTHGPRFKVGDWVRYRTTGESLQGFRTDYTVTVLIAGEEMWWGEKCFWAETRSAYSGQPPQVTASLISYGIFEDSLPSHRFLRYMRKYLDGLDDTGMPRQQPFRRADPEIKSHAFTEPEPPPRFDTLGVERVEVPRGAFEALKGKRLYRQAVTQQEGDSTVYFEKVETHTAWWSDQVPITRLVKVEQDNVQRRRVWLIGESAKAALQVAEHSTGKTELLDFGTGMKSSSIPERFQRPLSEQHPARAKPARRAAGKRG